MKKPILKLAIISTALNMSPSMASDMINIQSNSIKKEIMDNSFSLNEISDRELKKEIEMVLKQLISISKNVESFSSEEIEFTLLLLQECSTLLDRQYPETSNIVKSKILGKLLLEGVVIINPLSGNEINGFQVSLNQSIVSQLEASQSVIRAFAIGDRICM
jgi:hypothetical protein